MTHRYKFVGVIALLLAFLAPAAHAGISEDAQASQAAVVLRQLVRIPEQSIPPKLLQQAYAIAVIPRVLKIGFVFGGERGEGLLSVRTKSGKWSNPCFITLSGGSIGFQVGVSSTDIVLVFKNRQSVDSIAQGKFTLGVDGSVAAGPVGRSASAGTDIKFKSEILSYSRSRGVFAGVSAKGAVLQIDNEANQDFYDDRTIGPNNILTSTNRDALPKAGKDFMQTLVSYAGGPGHPPHYPDDQS